MNYADTAYADPIDGTARVLPAEPTPPPSVLLDPAAVAAAVARASEGRHLDPEEVEQQRAAHEIVRALRMNEDPAPPATPNVLFKRDWRQGPRGDEILDHQPIEDSLEWGQQYNPATGATSMFRRTPEQQAALRTEIIANRTCVLGQATLEDLRPYRVRAVWRVVRQIGILYGSIPPTMPLDEVNDDLIGPNPWYLPRPLHETLKAPSKWAEIRQIMVEAEDLPRAYRYHAWDPIERRVVEYPGLGLYPPPVAPVDLTARGDVAEHYDPTKDPALTLWIKLFDGVARRLFLGQGSPAEPHAGRFGLVAMNDPWLVRLAMPSPIELVVWENMVIDEILGLLVVKTAEETRKEIARRHGFQAQEITDFIRLAVKHSSTRTRFDLEEQRSLMIMRIEHFIGRCRDSLDGKGELNALRHLSAIQGLTHEGGQDFYQGMIDVVKTVSGTRNAKIVENTAQRKRGEPPQLPKQVQRSMQEQM